MALFLEKYNMSYVILERHNAVGSFWSRFPRFGELISVNKRTRNETQQWRFDWHSMLEAPLRMLDVTSRYFPTGKDWQHYMARVADVARLRIEYGIQVERIADDGTPCVTLLSGATRCANHRVFVSTGLEEKPEPLYRAMGGIPYSEMTVAQAVGRRVCILGNGNAGFEIAQNVFGVADRVVIQGKHPFRLSSITRYTGDVRTKFLQVFWPTKHVVYRAWPWCPQQPTDFLACAHQGMRLP